MAIRTLGSRYVLEEQIGQGGMGVVWRGRDKENGTPYAIKVLRPEYSADPEAVTRFVRERTVLMRFRHPAVVTVHDMIVEGDQLALVMDLVPGGDLTGYQRRRGGTLAPAEVADISAQICDGLDAAHSGGIVHRDLKPANVLLNDGRVQLADFGVARIVGDSSVTSSGIVLGTAAYLAPEMLTGSEPSPACDMYALGITMYEMLAGRPPFTGHIAAVMHDHLDTPPVRLPDIPGRLWDLISSCLAKTPQSRPTAAGLAVALRDPALVNSVVAAPAAVPGPAVPAPATFPPLAASRTGPIPPGQPPAGRHATGPLPPGPVPPGPVPPGPAGPSPVLPDSLMPGSPPGPFPSAPFPSPQRAPGSPPPGPAWWQSVKRGPRVLVATGAAVVLAGVIAIALLASGGGPSGHHGQAAESVGAQLPTAGPGSGPASGSAQPAKAAEHRHHRPGKAGAHPALPTTLPSPGHSAKPSPKSTSGTGGTLVPYGPNLVVDGDFSDGTLGPWQTNVNAVVTPGYGPGGAAAVRLTANPNAGIIEVITGLTPGTSYQVSGWGQAQGAKLFIGASDNDDQNTGIVGATFTSPTWRAGSAVFTLGVGQTSAKVFCAQGGGAIGYCTDISFRAMHHSH